MGEEEEFLPLKTRLINLAAMIVIVSVALLLLRIGGVLGKDAGRGIEAATMVDTPSSEAGKTLSVEAKVGKMAPNFELSDFNGQRHRLSDFRGSVVYLNFWATWCEPCIEELPSIYQLQEKYASDLSVVAVNRGQSLDRARPFFESLSRNDGGTGVSFTVDGMDPDETAYRAYRGLGMPVSVFVDDSGVVTKVHNGFMTAEEMEEAILEAIG